MIDEKKLIEEFRKYFDSMTPTYISKLAEAVVRDMIDIVEEQPKVGEWIPCSERLPKEDGKYLASTDGTFGIDIIDIARFENDEWFKSCKIIAWQPLPEPYKEE